ncbi:MAG: glycoside hydrolase family 95 protein [Oscillospiraceae bacterium]|nr:glycoside hydrolase family 95 protein [Oscillospiraceae bacterium]
MKHQIWLDKPAGKWDDGLFIGNGRIGASVLGQPGEEVIPLNEETIWYGGRVERDNPDCLAHLEEIRTLLRQGETERAAFLAKAAMTSTPKYFTPYQPAGDLRICYAGAKGEVKDYRRVLDLDNALAEVTFSMDGADWKREYFVSRLRNVLAIRISCSRPITLEACLNRRPYEEHAGRLDDRTAALWGQAGPEGVSFFSAVRIKGVSIRTVGSYVLAENAPVVELYISIGTDFLSERDYKADCLTRLNEAEKLGFDALKAEHLADWHSFFDRVSFSLDSESDRTTSGQLADLREGGDERALCENLFHFGRYLLLSSSLSCRLPANLQGIWNGSFTPSWECNYTININTEMNYWPAEVCSLPECCEPLFSLVERMVPRGQKNARVMYGCDGFVAHHCTNLWADTSVEGIFDSSPFWPMGGAWLSLHFYEHYRYTGDEEFLRERALPVLEQNILFFTQYLTDGKDGTLITGPSLSPENSYRSAAGQVGALCMAPTMDSQILRELFTAYLEGCGILGVTGELVEKAKDVLSRLPETEISSDGRIREWQEEYGEVEPGHRHVSHLFGLFPGSQITEKTPDLMAAADKTLRHRLENGGGHTGWSCTWIICFYARLLQGESCRKYLRQLLSRSMQDNLLDSHPPFQIDGNLGVTAAMAEMLCQSHDGCIRLLPALPEVWRSGCLTGVTLRGNIRLELFWKDGALDRAVLVSPKDCAVSVRLGEREAAVSLKAGTAVTLTDADFC